MKHDYMVEGIEKLTYEKTWFNVQFLKIGGKDRVTVDSEGNYKYERFTRTEADTPLKKVSTVKKNIGKEVAKKLYEDVIYCLRNAESVLGYIDDSEFTVKLEYGSGEISVPRGLKAGDKDMNQVMEDFFGSIGE